MKQKQLKQGSAPGEGMPARSRPSAGLRRLVSSSTPQTIPSGERRTGILLLDRSAASETFGCCCCGGAITADMSSVLVAAGGVGGGKLKPAPGDGAAM